MAITAAEHAIRAIKLSNDPTTVKSMRAKSEQFMDEAQRIKSSQQWIPQKPAQINVAQVAKLPEPTSTRKLSTAEQILLLRSSQLNGFKFLPWDSAPRDDDFHLAPNQEPFT
jgi:calpain-7